MVLEVHGSLFSPVSFGVAGFDISMVGVVHKGDAISFVSDKLGVKQAVCWRSSGLMLWLW